MKNVLWLVLLLGFGLMPALAQVGHQTVGINCPKHGFIAGDYTECPRCAAERAAASQSAPSTGSGLTPAQQMMMQNVGNASYNLGYSFGQWLFSGPSAEELARQAEARNQETARVVEKARQKELAAARRREEMYSHLMNTLMLSGKTFDGDGGKWMNKGVDVPDNPLGLMLGDPNQAAQNLRPKGTPFFGQGGGTTSANALGLMLGDPNVVDLRAARTLTIDPAKVQGIGGAGVGSSSPDRLPPPNPTAHAVIPQLTPAQAINGMDQKLTRLHQRIDGLQQALERMRKSSDTREEDRREWEAMLDDAYRSSLTNAFDTVVDLTGWWLKKANEAQTKELRSALDQLISETEQARRERLHLAIKMMDDNRARIEGAQNAVEGLHIMTDVREITELLNSGAPREKVLSLTRMLVEKAADNEQVKAVIGLTKNTEVGFAGACLKSSADSAYHVSEELVSIWRIHAIKQERTEYVKALETVQSKMADVSREIGTTEQQIRDAKAFLASTSQVSSDPARIAQENQ